MANTYTQIHVQIVFVVKNRECIISNKWKNKLYKYITGIVQKNNHKLLIINGMPDHVHVLVGMRPKQSLSELVQDIKGSSSKWINEKGFVMGRFSWQPGYAAFSYSKRELKNVIGYIQNQEKHHLMKSFTEEYLELLRKAEIDFDERYTFSPVNYL